jgi:hypothetical protein
MNRITDQMQIGTVGELLVQLRLLQYQVQAAPPLKDSGNDLIAVRGEVFRAIQVKTTTEHAFKKPNKLRLYHILAVVTLAADEDSILLDESLIFLIPKTKVEEVSTQVKDLEPYKLTKQYVEELFTPEQ